MFVRKPCLWCCEFSWKPTNVILDTQRLSQVFNGFTMIAWTLSPPTNDSVLRLTTPLDLEEGIIPEQSHEQKPVREHDGLVRDEDGVVLRDVAGQARFCCVPADSDVVLLDAAVLHAALVCQARAVVAEVVVVAAGVGEVDAAPAGGLDLLDGRVRDARGAEHLLEAKRGGEDEEDEDERGAGQDDGGEELHRDGLLDEEEGERADLDVEEDVVEDVRRLLRGAERDAEPLSRLGELRDRIVAEEEGAREDDLRVSGGPARRPRS